MVCQCFELLKTNPIPKISLENYMYVSTSWPSSAVIAQFLVSRQNILLTFHFEENARASEPFMKVIVISILSIQESYVVGWPNYCT